MLNSISRTFVKTLRETKVLARDLSDNSGISEQTISVIKRGHQKSANVETVDSLLAALPVQDQINFIIELLCLGESATDNLNLFVKLLPKSQQRILQEALDSLSSSLAIQHTSSVIFHREILSKRRLTSMVHELNSEEAAYVLQAMSNRLRQHHFNFPQMASIGSLALIDSTPVATEGILGLTLEGNIAHANGQFARIWQLPESLVMELENDRLLLPYLAERVQDPASFLAAVDSDVQYPTQSRHHLVPLKDGRILERRSTPLHIRGQYSGRAIRYRDVTDVNAIAKALRDSERQFRSFFDQNSISMAITDLSGRYLRANQAFCDLVGYSEIELLQMRFHDLSLDEDLEREIPQFEQMQRNETATYSLEKRYCGRDGSPIWTQIYPCLVHDESGRPLYIVTTIQNITEQKQQALQREQAELRLQQSESRYRAIVQDQTDLISRFRPDTTLLFVNNAYANYLGRDRDELIGQQWVSLLPPEQQSSALQALARLSIQNPVKTDVESVQVNGEWRWVQWISRVVATDGEGNITEIQSVGQDITELKRSQDRLAEREQLISSIMQNVPGAVYRGEHSREWRDSFMSPAIEEITGYPWQEFEPHGDRDYGSIMHPDDIDWVYEAEHKATIDAKEPFELEYRVLHQDGNVRWVLERGRGSYSKEGELTSIDGIIFDITDRKRDQSELEWLTRHIPGAIFRCADDDDWTMHFISEGIADLTGYPSAAFLANQVSFKDLIHPDDLDRVMEAGLNNPPSYAYAIEYRIVRRDGRINSVCEQTQAIVNAQGQITEWSGVILAQFFDAQAAKPPQAAKRKSSPRRASSNKP